MAHVGFWLESVGAGPASISVLDIAVAHTNSRGTIGGKSVFKVRAVGQGGTALGPVVAGQANTAETLGQYFPSVNDGMTFPPNLAGKHIQLDLESGFAIWDTRYRLKLTIQERTPSNEFKELYSWEGDVPFQNNTYAGGVAVEGTAHEISLFAAPVFSRIMHVDPDGVPL